MSVVDRPSPRGLAPRLGAAIDELCSRWLGQRRSAGVVVVVSIGDELRHQRAYGLRDVAAGAPMRDDALFRIMSMTKPIVAASALMLCDEGALDLHVPVSRFLPEFAKPVVAELSTAADGGESGAPYRLVPATRPITVYDLLTHTSGLMGNGVSQAEVMKVAPRPAEALATYVPRLGSVPLGFQPGTQWLYSGSVGYDVLARVIEIVTGAPFDAFVRARIFEPLQMHDTAFTAVDERRLATLYTPTRDGFRPIPAPSFLNGTYVSGGGGLFSTAGDYWRFARLLANEGLVDGRRLLHADSVALMRSPLVPDSMPGRHPGESYGLGVRVVVEPGVLGSTLLAGSFGWSGAFGTHFWIEPVTRTIGIAMMQMTNQANLDTLRQFEALVTRELT